MAAPKNPVTGPATAGKIRKAQQRKSDELHAVGWTAYPPSGEGHDKLPTPSLAALRAHKALMDELHQWAPTVHRLVRERIAALMEAYGPHDHPLETPEEHAARVLAHGQNPFPAGVSIYENLNDNRGYDHIGIGYGMDGDGELRITFTGWYPHWVVVNDDTGEDAYERRAASIHCPGWLVTEPDGIDRYRAQTEQMATAVRQQVEADNAALSAFLDRHSRNST